MAARSTPVLIGVDLGKVTTALAWAEPGEDGRLGSVASSCDRHLGDPLRPLLELYRRLCGDGVPPAAVAATGLYGDRLAAPVLSGLPVETAQDLAAAKLYPDGPLNVVSIGGSGYSVLARAAAGDVTFETNERCSAGTGETVEALCARLGASIEEAVALARSADGPIAVTSRCAVFAKSELTHYANQGEPHGRLFLGVFESVARNVHALYDKVKAAGPVVLIGNGATIEPLADAFARLAGATVTVPPGAGVFEALGALEYARRVAAGEQDHASTPGGPAAQQWPADLAALVEVGRRRIRRLTPASAGPGALITLNGTHPGGAGGSSAVGHPAAAGDSAALPPASARGAGLVLGLDLGSTGSKAALLDAASGAVLDDVYRRTDGNPVEAAKALIAELLSRDAAAAPVIAVGLTGSGRDAVATVFRAVYPHAGAGLTVQNEIVAHATAAMRLDPDHGRSLSIVEIGGQDAKFINVRGGHIVESDMNRVCSAGTGSFLEEQARAHGLDDIALFGTLAAQSSAPPDLGTTCTVFVADVAAEALADGYRREDIFAGLQYSVVRNYRHRVMGQRRFLERIFFQGKPATNASLARTLAAVTGREVWVPANPGAMGAIGIALLAAGELAKGAGAAGAAEPLFDLTRVLEANITARRELRCGDRACANLCRIEKATVSVGGQTQTIMSGGTCPKYDSVSAVGPKLPKDAPNPFREREELLSRLLAGEDDIAHRDGARGEGSAAPPVVAIPYAHYLIDLLPFFDGFFRALGAEVRVVRTGPGTLAAGDRLCSAAGVCAPAKLLHGLAAEAAGADFVFAPKFVHLAYHNSGSGTSTCPMAQGAPELVDTALRDSADCAPAFLRPVLLRREGTDLGSADAAAALAAVARRLGRRRAFAQAYRYAKRQQRRFDEGRAAIGRRALGFAAATDCPAVLIAGETHVLHESLLDCGVAALAAANGAVAVPIDCYAVPASAPPLRRMHWASAGAILRGCAQAMDEGVFPVLVCAYGCGPNSLIEGLFNDLLAEYPHAVLESDGHGGNAGYVTRMQAFLHSVRSYRLAARSGAASGRASACDEPAAGRHVTPAGGRAAAPPASLARYDEAPLRRLSGSAYRRVLLSTVGGTLGRQIAAGMRGTGLPAAYVSASDVEAFELSHDACSGKECLPYQLIWGTLARRLAAEEAAAGPVAAGGGKAVAGPAAAGSYEAAAEPAAAGSGEGTAGGAPTGDGAGRTLFLSVGQGFRACRAHVFPIAQQIALAQAGRHDIDVADISVIYDDVTLVPAIWSAMVAVDLLNIMRFYHYADEAEPGSSDALFAHFSDELERILERPRRVRRGLDRPGAGELLGQTRTAWSVVGEVAGVVGAAAAAYAGLAADTGRRAGLRNVYLSGDIFLRVDEWGNDDIQHRLSRLGLRVFLEPFAEFFELLALNDYQVAPRFSRRAAIRLATIQMMGMITQRLVAAARAHEPWIWWHDVRDVMAQSDRLFDGFPFGESVATIGSSLLTWRTEAVDGVVVVSPRTCAPALISEAQLRRDASMPLLYVYNDGDPVDDARLAGFAWRLRSRPRRG